MLTRVVQTLLVACVSFLIVAAFTCEEDLPTPLPTASSTPTVVPTSTPLPIFATREAERPPTATPTATSTPWAVTCSPGVDDEDCPELFD